MDVQIHIRRWRKTRWQALTQQPQATAKPLPTRFAPAGGPQSCAITQDPGLSRHLLVAEETAGNPHPGALRAKEWAANGGTGLGGGWWGSLGPGWAVDGGGLLGEAPRLQKKGNRARLSLDKLCGDRKKTALPPPLHRVPDCWTRGGGGVPGRNGGRHSQDEEWHSVPGTSPPVCLPFWTCTPRPLTRAHYFLENLRVSAGLILPPLLQVALPNPPRPL